jgi:hypothetical protein
MKFVKLPIARTSLPRPEAPGSKGSGPRFAHLRMGRELPKSATAPSPTIKHAAARKPAPEPAVSAAQAHARVATVFASEHSVGRERQAADMLGTSMSADEITGLLAKQPKDAGVAANNQMLARLTAQPNPRLGLGSDSDHSRVSADEFWTKVRAANGSR